MSDDRLAIIEKKIDQMVEAITRLAVVDERLTNLISQNQKISEKLEDHETKISNTDARQQISDAILKRIEKVMWILGIGLATALADMVFRI
jgi:ribosome maturation protein Sdo1